MKIYLELFGHLLPDRARRQTHLLDQTITVKQFAQMIDLDLAEVGLITINGIQADAEEFLPPDCRLCFFTYLSGG